MSYSIRTNAEEKDLFNQVKRYAVRCRASNTSIVHCVISGGITRWNIPLTRWNIHLSRIVLQYQSHSHRSTVGGANTKSVYEAVCTYCRAGTLTFLSEIVLIISLPFVPSTVFNVLGSAACHLSLQVVASTAFSLFQVFTKPIAPPSDNFVFDFIS